MAKAGKEGLHWGYRGYECLPVIPLGIDMTAAACRGFAEMWLTFLAWRLNLDIDPMLVKLVL